MYNFCARDTRIFFSIHYQNIARIHIREIEDFWKGYPFGELEISLISPKCITLVFNSFDIFPQQIPSVNEYIGVATEP